MDRKKLSKKLRQILSEQGWLFDAVGSYGIKGYVSIRINGSIKNLPFFAAVEDKGFWIVEQYPEAIAASADVFELLLRINERRLLGSFQFDFDTSSISYKSAYPLSVIEYGDCGDMDEFLQLPARMIARYLPLIIDVSAGRVKLADAIKNIG